MLKLRASHRTEIAYAGAVHTSINEVRQLPRHDGRQKVDDPYVHVEPLTDVFLHTDAFGNRVAWFQIEAPHDRLVIQTTAVVTLDSAPVRPDVAVPWRALDGPEVRNEVGEYLLESPRVAQSEALEAFANDIGLDGVADVAEWLHRIEAAIPDAVEYRPGSTTVDSTLEQLLADRRGVCQDMAHLFLALCRRRGVPARYVSGWLHEPNRASPNESHAWCEAWLPGVGWVEYDPARPGPSFDHHIRIGVGRDYSDVAPVRGHYVGPPTVGMDVTVELTPVDS